MFEPDCKYHNPTHSTLTVDRSWACTCVEPLMFSCETCQELKVPKKLPGLGYICDECLRDSVND